MTASTRTKRTGARMLISRPFAASCTIPIQLREFAVRSRGVGQPALPWGLARPDTGECLSSRVALGGEPEDPTDMKKMTQGRPSSARPLNELLAVIRYG